MALKMAGTLILDIPGVLLELSPVQKNGMTELTAGDRSKWQATRINRCLKSCGGHVFYKAHPEAVAFLRNFWTERTYKEGEKYVSLCSMGDTSRPAVLALEDIWAKANAKYVGCIGNYFSDEGNGGWAMVGSVPPNSALMPVVLSDLFSRFRSHVMGLPSREVRRITKAMLDDHYIHFEIRNSKGNYNSLKALVPIITDIFNKPRFPTPEIEELCGISERG